MAGDAVFRVPHCPLQPRVLHADNRILVVDKPPGLLSVPGRHPDNRDCLVTRLQAQWPDATIVHRLDMATSGLMVLALTREAHSQLGRQFQHRQVEKHYLAVVQGIVTDDSGAIDLPLITDWPRRPLQKVCFEQGKPSQTGFQVLTRDHQRQVTLLRLAPRTGRSHQLRVHLMQLGHPILGDDFYAPADVKSRAPRLLLHASTLAFQHPATGRILNFQAPCDLLPLVHSSDTKNPDCHSASLSAQ